MELSRKLSIEDISFGGKRALVRVDYNVPMNDDGTISNNQRIVATLPTIRRLLAGGARSIVLMSHLGRPDGVSVSSLTLRPIAVELERLLKTPVTFLPDCVGEQVEEACASPSLGQVFLLENLRFHVEEEGKVARKDGTKAAATKDQVNRFRESLSRLGDFYVQDAFGTVHRPHSSIVGISLEPRVAGLLVKKELEFFGRALEGPERIDLAILGGAKVSDKLPLIRNMIKRVRRIMIGGGMPFTFLKSCRNMKIGDSLFDEKGSQAVGDLLQEAKKEGVEVLLPVDFVTGDSFSANAKVGCATVDGGIEDKWMGLDIGPQTIEVFGKIVEESKSILWNGPVGAFELEPFETGTREILEYMVRATKKGALTIVGGGDSSAAVAKWSAGDKLVHVSTGGGASLELLEGRSLPGIAALSTRS